MPSFRRVVSCTLVAAFLAIALLVARAGSVKDVAWRAAIVPEFSLSIGEDMLSALGRLRKVSGLPEESFSVQWFLDCPRKSAAKISLRHVPIDIAAEAICTENGLASIITERSILVFELSRIEAASVFVCRGEIQMDRDLGPPVANLKVSMQVGQEMRESLTVLDDSGRYISILPVSETKDCIVVGKQRLVTIGSRREWSEIRRICVEADGYEPFSHVFSESLKSPLQNIDVKLRPTRNGGSS